jgi:hypothetical protein
MRSVPGLSDVGLGVLAELGEKLMDAGEDCLVAFGFARPAAFGGVLDELLLACQASRGVVKEAVIKRRFGAFPQFRSL